MAHARQSRPWLSGKSRCCSLSALGSGHGRTSHEIVATFGCKVWPPTPPPATEPTCHIQDSQARFWPWRSGRSRCCLGSGHGGISSPPSAARSALHSVESVNAHAVERVRRVCTHSLERVYYVHTHSLGTHSLPVWRVDWGIPYRRHHRLQGPPQKTLCGGIPGSFLEPLARSWSHFVGTYCQKLRNSVQN